MACTRKFARKGNGQLPLLKKQDAHLLNEQVMSSKIRALMPWLSLCIAMIHSL